MKTTILLTLMIVSFNSFCASVSIPLKSNNMKMEPARDLVYKGKRIDSYQAQELKDQGIKLHELDPYESTLWQNKKHQVKTIDIPSQTYELDNYKSSPTEIFRAYLTGEGDNKRYVVTASLDNHENMVRAGLLKALGYNIEVPKFYKKLKINFTTKKSKELFIEKVGEKTLSKRTRWVGENSSDTTVVLKDVLLENAELKNVPIYLPLMVQSRQAHRRVFRGLLSIYAITNFNQTLNSTPWKVGRTFNNFLNISLPFGDQFRNVTIDDLIWMQNRLRSLSTADLIKIYSLSGYPKDLAQLAMQKFISRLNSLNDHLSLPQHLEAQRYITNSSVTRGVLKTNPNPKRVREYLRENQKSPYNMQDLLKLFKAQTTYGVLSQVLSEAIEKFVPGIHVNDAAQNIQEQIADYRIDNPSSARDGLPIKFFAYPMANVSAFANRNIVFGKQFGRSAPIQMVDSVSTSANLGVFTMLTGITNDITPSISAQANLIRNYTHVRPMPDLETATSQELKKVLIPKLMKSLSKIISTEVICSLQGEVNVIETEVNETPVVYIKYDKNITDAREKAIAKRAELIAQGTSEDIILLVPINIEEECVEEIAQTKEKDLDSFLKELALNETFIISDTLQLTNTNSATIPMDNYAGVALSANIGGDIAKGILRSITIRKEDSEIEVTVQTQKNMNKSLYMGLNYFIEVLRGTVKWLNGEQKSRIYKIPFEGLSNEQRSLTLKTLHQLFAMNSLTLLEENFSPISITNNISGSIKSIDYLWYKSEAMKMDNLVNIELPAKEHPNLSLEQRTKKLFATSSIRRNGKDIFGFLNKIVNKFSRFINLGQNPSDAGQAIKGSSKSRYYVSEADITTGQQPITTTKIDYVWKGWQASPSKLNAIFNFIEGLYSDSEINNLIDRSRFQDQGVLRGYEVKSTFIVYPEFLDDFNDKVINSPKEYAIKFLKNLYGENKWNRYCKRKNKSSGKRYRFNRNCTPRAVKSMLSYRKQVNNLKLSKEVKKQNKIITLLLEGFDRKKVFAWMSSQKSLFSSTRVTGFKENSEKGYVDYISNTFGHYNRKHGTGVFDQISSLLGISPYDLRAMNYTPGL